jgi:hypothetical protein
VQVGLLPISPVHEQLQLLPAAWRQLYLQEVQKAAPGGSKTFRLLTYVEAPLYVLFRHLHHVHSALDEQEQQQQQQKEHVLAANTTPAAAPAPPGVAAAAAAVAASCGLSYLVTTEQAVLLVIGVLQLLAAMSEQDDQQLQFDSLDMYRHGALLLQQQLVVMQTCPALHERHSSVVQQSAQQLMQLLCWQLQQAAQRSTPPRGADASEWEEVVDSISDSAKETLFDDLVDRCSGLCSLSKGSHEWHTAHTTDCYKHLPAAMLVFSIPEVSCTAWNLTFHAFEPCRGLMHAAAAAPIAGCIPQAGKVLALPHLLYCTTLNRWLQCCSRSTAHTV